MTTLSLKNINKIYEGNVIAVKDLDIQVEDGELFALLGPSGCGKSSTLRMIAGLEKITSGELWFDDRLVNDLEPRERNIAMVFETYALYSYLSVYENIAFPLRIRGMKRHEIDNGRVCRLGVGHVFSACRRRIETRHVSAWQLGHSREIRGGTGPRIDDRATCLRRRDSVLQLDGQVPGRSTARFRHRWY